MGRACRARLALRLESSPGLMRWPDIAWWTYATTLLPRLGRVKIFSRGLARHR